MIQLENKEKYIEYHKANDELYFNILQEHLKSDYSDSVLEIENKYPMGPISGYVTEKYHENATYNAIDINKAYTDCLSQINHVPVFGYFDEYKPYDNHAIENYTMYLVEVHVKNDVEKKPVAKKAREQKVIVEKEYLNDKRLSLDLFAGDVEEEDINDFIKSFWDDMAIFHRPKKAPTRKPIKDVVVEKDQLKDVDEVEVETPIKSSIAQSILFLTVHHRCFGLF